MPKDGCTVADKKKAPSLDYVLDRKLEQEGLGLRPKYQGCLISEIAPEVRIPLTGPLPEEFRYSDRYF